MIVSIHNYELAAEAKPEDFEAAITEAESLGLFSLPGLQSYEFLRGIKGHRVEKYTAIWRYESRDAWEMLWGTVDEPLPKSEYPEKWQTWEDNLLAPLLSEDPDKILFTSYSVVSDSD